LDTPVGQLAADAWARSVEVQQACRRTAGRLGAREVVAMLEHSVKTRQAIEVEVEMDRARHVILTLTLRVTIDVKAVTVVVESGRMAAIRPGVASTSATLSIGDIQVATGTLKDVSLDLNARSSRSAA